MLLMPRSCSTPTVVVGVTATVAAFFAMGAVLGRLLYEYLQPR